MLFGSTASGGYYGNGSVFIIDTNGTGFLSAHSFTASALDYNESSPAYFTVTNGDGTFPQAGLSISGTTIYGITRNGGTNGSGTIFSLNQLTGVSTVHAFTANILIPGQTNTDCYTNYEGANPSSDLVGSGTTLYGVAQNGGYSSGTVFKMNTDGTGVTTLHSFSLLTPETITRNGFLQLPKHHPNPNSLEQLRGAGRWDEGKVSSSASGLISFDPVHIKQSVMR